MWLLQSLQISLMPKTLLPWINTISKLDDINLTAKAKTNAEDMTKRFQEKSKWYRMEVNTEKSRVMINGENFNENGINQDAKMNVNGKELD